MTSNVSHASTVIHPLLFRTRDVRSSRHQHKPSEQLVNDSGASKMMNTFRKYLKTSEVIKGEQKLSPMKETELSDAFSSASLLAEIDAAQKEQLTRKKRGCFDYTKNAEGYSEEEQNVENSAT